MSGRRVAPRDARPARVAESTLRVDPVACEGIGMCAHLAVGVIRLDSWGYPVLPSGPLTGHELRAARAGVAGCPRKALFLRDSGARSR